MNNKVELFTYALSPYGMKVYWALMYKSIDFNLQYVDPRSKREISFTSQPVVPVVKINDDWKLDSGPICCWLDELYPERPIAGVNDQERAVILASDEWVTDNVIALGFRSIIEKQSLLTGFRNGRLLAQTMKKTSGNIPWFAQFIWVQMLRRTPFIIKEANKLDKNISVADCRASIIEQLDVRLKKTGYIAGTNTPSYADISLFAQLVSNSTLGRKPTINANSSASIKKFYQMMCRHIDLSSGPELIPNWQPFGF